MTTVEERLTRLEQRIDQLDRIEARLTGIEQTLVGLRSDMQTYQAQQAQVLERILGTLTLLQQRPAFRWPWEPRP
jgi:hypothetical protein